MIFGPYRWQPNDDDPFHGIYEWIKGLDPNASLHYYRPPQHRFAYPDRHTLPEQLPVRPPVPQVFLDALSESELRP